VPCSDKEGTDITSSTINRSNSNRIRTGIKSLTKRRFRATALGQVWKEQDLDEAWEKREGIKYAPSGRIRRIVGVIVKNFWGPFTLRFRKEGREKLPSSPGGRGQSFGLLKLHRKQVPRNRGEIRYELDSQRSAFIEGGGGHSWPSRERKKTKDLPSCRSRVLESGFRDSQTRWPF